MRRVHLKPPQSPRTALYGHFPNMTEPWVQDGLFREYNPYPRGIAILTWGGLREHHFEITDEGIEFIDRMVAAQPLEDAVDDTK